MKRIFGKGWVLVLVLMPCLATAQPQEDLWQALAEGGHVALLRHALAPGTGDPADFQVDDCATQRNLSEQGREQARRIGERFRARGLGGAPVYSSQWCRCLDTARLLDLGPVTPYPGLNSFFRRRALEPERTTAALELIRRHAGGPSLVLVTHQVNVTALTGVYPRSGEVVVGRWDGDELRVLGRIATPAGSPE